MLHGVCTPALGLLTAHPHTHLVLYDLWGHALSDTPHSRTPPRSSTRSSALYSSISTGARMRTAPCTSSGTPSAPPPLRGLMRAESSFGARGARRRRLPRRARLDPPAPRRRPAHHRARGLGRTRTPRVHRARKGTYVPAFIARLCLQCNIQPDNNPPRTPCSRRSRRAATSFQSAVHASFLALPHFVRCPPRPSSSSCFPFSQPFSLPLLFCCPVFTSAFSWFTTFLGNSGRNGSGIRQASRWYLMLMLMRYECQSASPPRPLHSVSLSGSAFFYRGPVSPVRRPACLFFPLSLPFPYSPLFRHTHVHQTKTKTLLTSV
ncbi:hypothetical protein B0H11DRAFT_1284460 [Mycena galericulata]|nr:hypothetical protein B0H11DRAFT_1284460 [Mycena galericulata]